jgi:asparagine synthetase B (glutamine-hydrolysing)
MSDEAGRAAGTAARLIPITGLELATGVTNGAYPHAPPIPEPIPGVGARSAMEGVIREGLRHPPCVVTFSGGRDSSAVLAMAALVARRHGLEPPIPFTLRFPSVVTAAEDEWQRPLIDRLQLGDRWIRLDVDHEADCVGPWARQVHGQLGLVWPFNSHFLLPMAQAAAGGTLLTGVGGDEMLTPASVYQVAELVAGRRRPGRNDFRRVARALAPRALRREVLRRRWPSSMRWLTAGAEAEHRRREAAFEAAAPMHWGRQLARYTWPTRYIHVARASLAAVAAVGGARVLHPLHEPPVVAALAQEGGFVGLGTRTQAMIHLFGDLLPPEHLSRRSKATFGLAFWSRHARAMAGAWDGTGLNPDLVDSEVLAQEWAEECPDARSYLMLQKVWIDAGMPALSDG